MYPVILMAVVNIFSIASMYKELLRHYNLFQPLITCATFSWFIWQHMLIGCR